MEVTKREILVSVIIGIVLLTIGMFISNAIDNAIEEDNEKYYKATQIDDDYKFQYALRTNIGYVFVYGKVFAVEGVSIPDIEGKYFEIEKVKERYTEHTKQVEETHTRSDGTTYTTYRTETYWTWDRVDSWNWHTEKFNFAGVDFVYGTINFGGTSYQEMKQESYYIRYKYYTKPLQSEGTLFTNIQDNSITENSFSTGKNIEQTLKSKTTSSVWVIVLFWILWIGLSSGIIYGFCYLDNKYLEDK